jgi:hypothetical protein
MKLYTEEQVKQIQQAILCNHKDAIMYANYCLSVTTPIELPSNSLCINCDESKSTHNVCMDCIIKIGKENIELPSDEEIDKANPFVFGSKHLGTRDMDIWELGAKWMRDKIQGGDK